MADRKLSELDLLLTNLQALYNVMRSLSNASEKLDEKVEAEPTRSHGSIDAPRRFLMWRSKDHSGVSGTGYVASGVEFPDGTVAVRWFGHDPSTSLWASVETLEAVHGHNGSTTIEWMD